MPKSVLSLIKIILAVLTIIFSAQLTYDLQLGEHSIPITGQTLAILTWAVFMRPWESFSAVSIYILLGLYGLPVFANGASGLEVLYGNTGGYLVGFLLGALVVSWIRDPYRKENIFSLFLLMLAGTAIIMTCGIIRMSMILGVDESLNYGFYALWKGAVVKIILGTIMSYGIHLIVRAFEKKLK